MNESDPHDEIERLEALIEELSSRLESCRKFILGARIAIAAGGILLAALLFGAVRFDARLMLVAAAAVLGGIVAWGSNDSTAKETAAEMAATEAERGALIERLELRPVAETRTLH